MRLLKRLLISLLVIALFIFIYNITVYAVEKNWSGTGDGVSWSDEDNWSPASVPTPENEVVINAENANVECNRTFKAKSITIGGRQDSTLTSEDFIYGTILPDSFLDNAILIRSGGKLILKGAGTITVGGKYTDSEESLKPEPSFIFWVK